MDQVLIFAAGELVIILVMAGLIFSLKGEDQQARLLHFGAVVLTALALIFALGMAMYFWAEGEAATRSQKIFDSCVTIIPPIVTLVIGYYFGKQERSP